ncbi:MAG: pantetheine-phosphate adenylyltransferase, partial [Cellvibrionales bacterium]|nr:pantetheine-phosphate adenylyltransferase [Cellvibrionales bacterium]
MTKRPTTIIYPGTFDPITLGHINLVERAAKLFGKVVVSIASSQKKSPLFTLDERLDLCRHVLSHLDNIEVVGFSGLIVDLMQDHQADAVLRGVRSMTDFDYEFQMANMNQAMLPDFETLFLTPHREYSFISSSLIREIAAMQGDVTSFVHPF